MKQRLNILLLEDTNEQIQWIQQSLQLSREFQVALSIAKNLRMALDSIVSQELDLVLIALSVPEQEKYHVFMQLRDVAGHLPFILLFDVNDEFMAYQAVKHGAQEVLFREELTSGHLLRTVKTTFLRSNHYKKILSSKNELSANNESLLDILQHLGTGLVILDRYKHVQLVNGVAQEWLGQTEKELLDEELSFPIIPGETIELALSRKTGEVLPIEFTVRDFEWRGEPGFIGTMRNIAEDKKLEHERSQNDEIYTLMARGANDGLWSWDVQSGYLEISPRWKLMLGYEEHELNPHIDEWFNRIHHEDRPLVEHEIHMHFQGRTEYFENEHRLMHRDGYYRWVRCRGIAALNIEREPYLFAGSLTDVTVRKQLEVQLRHDVLHDALTGLPNRALFMDRLNHALHRAKFTEDYVFAVLFLDVDNFKKINDRLGLSVGDRLLHIIAQNIYSCLRPGDTLARIGGDEFAVLIDDIHDDKSASYIADSIQKELAKPIPLGGEEVVLSASIGITLNRRRYAQAENILRDADTAMASAKRQGKARHKLFKTDMYVKTKGIAQMEVDLRQAIKGQEFAVHYQPIVSLKTGRLSGFEALVRWNHPEKGFISPGLFIPLAEENGMIIEIGSWVMRQACKQMQSWQKRIPCDPPLTISVNVSPRQLVHPELIEDIELILAETGLPTRSLKLEITESSLINNIDEVNAKLLQLRALGLQMYVDDFGTGYSSLAYLANFPVDTLKIDRSFIMDMTKDSEQASIVKTISKLARDLGLTVIAEGIEEFEQLKQLKTFHCGYGQGYYFAKPLNAIDAEQLLHSEKEWSLTTAES